MLRLAYRLIENAKWLVPARSRDAWCEAWKNELWHRAESLRERDGLDRTQELDLLRRSLGALTHAFWLSGRDWRISLVYHDLIYGLRSWVGKPLFTLVVLLTLGLGIGANTYIFSVIDGLVLNPFPFRDADRLVALGATFPQFSNDERFIEAVSVPDYQALLRESRTLDGFLAFDLGNRDLGGVDEPQRLFTAAFWGDPFETLGMEPALGRSFTEEEVEKRLPVAIVSHRVWQQQLGGDPDAVGDTIVINGSPRTLVGVMPPRLLLLDTDLWLPMWYTATEMPRSRRVLTVLARIRDGAGLTEVRTELGAFAARIAQDLSAEAPEYAGFRLSASPFVDVWASFVGPAGPILLGAVAFVLLIVCSNVAGLLLARASSRRHEMAVRAAMGAGRGRILQQLLTESALLALVGGAFGILIAYGALELTVAHLPAELPLGGIELGIHQNALVYTLAVSIFCGVFFGLAPALTSSRVDVQANLAAEGARTTDSASATLTRRLFVAFQIALCLVLLAGAGLLIKSFTNLSNVNPGVDVDNVLTMRLTLAWERYEGKFEGFYSQMIEEVGMIPGVRSAAVATQFPPMVLRDRPFQIEGREPDSDGALPTANVTVVSPRLFETLGITLVRGRGFEEHETVDSPQVSILNQAAARQYFPDGDPLGQRVKTGGGDSEAPWATVIGIVSDARNRGVDRAPHPEIYLSYRQRGQWSNQVFLLVRTESDPMAMLPTVRDVLKQIDPHQPVYLIETLAGRFQSTIATRRIASTVLLALAAAALLLAAMGVYGVVAFLVSERERELGIRLALGASGGQLQRFVLMRTSKLVMLGVVLGAPGAVGLAGTLRAYLFEVSPYDPATLAATASLLVGVTLVAALGPARRAARVNPLDSFK